MASPTASRTEPAVDRHLGLPLEEDEDLLHVLVVMGGEALAGRQPPPIDHRHRARHQLPFAEQHLLPGAGRTGSSWLAGTNEWSAP